MLYLSTGPYNKAYHDALVMLTIGSILLTVLNRLLKLLGVEVSITNLYILLLLLMVCAIGFRFTSAKVGEEVARSRYTLPR